MNNDREDNETISYLEGQLSILGTAIVLLARGLLSEEDFTEFRSQLEELAVGAAETTSVLRQQTGRRAHDTDQFFLLGISERTDSLLHMLASLKTE